MKNRSIIKSLLERRRIEGAAYMHKPTGKVFGPYDTHADGWHDEGLLRILNIEPQQDEAWDDIADQMIDFVEDGTLIEGFVTNDGTFLTREQAAKATKFSSEEEPDRDWLDSFDVLDRGFDTIHENDQEPPPSVITAFTELGELQRGAPEQLMLRVQRAMGGGVLNVLVEHIGDLTHRMTTLLRHNWNNAGEEMVAEKVKRGLRYLQHPYGFEREHNQNLQNNAKALSVPVEQYKAQVDQALRQYAQAHMELPVYNKAQFYARNAAVAIGEQNWSQAEKYLGALQNMLNDDWHKHATAYKLDQQGNPLRYPWSMTEDYKWTDPEERLGGLAGTMVDRAVFEIDDRPYYVEFYDWSDHAGMFGFGPRVYQIGFRPADRDEYESDVRTGDTKRPRAVINAVKQVVADWIKREKPSAVVMGSYDEQKNRIYRKLAFRAQEELSKHGYKSRPFENHGIVLVRQLFNEDVESDSQSQQIISDVVDRIKLWADQHADYFSASLISKDGWTTYKGKPAVAILGSVMNLPKPFDEIAFLLLPVNPTKPAWFGPIKNPEESRIWGILGISVLPKQGEKVQKVKEALITLMHSQTLGYIVHELVHALQTYNDTIKDTAFQKLTTPEGGIKSKEYYNAPHEFDAYYKQITRDMFEILRVYEDNPEQAQELAELKGIEKDFWKTLNNILANSDYYAHAYEFFDNLRKKRRKRFLSRLYQLHQQILKLDIVKESIMREQEDDEDDHSMALAQTGYWGRSGAGCIIMANETKRFLIPFRSEWVEQPHTWGTWGGAIDRGEKPEHAVIREVQEEAGYHGPILGIKHLYRYQDQSFRYDTFLVIVDEEFEPTLNWESEKAEWFEFGNWPKPLHFGLKEVLSDSRALNKLGMASS